MSADSSRFAKPAWALGLPSNWQVLPIKKIVSTPITDGPHETPEFLDEGVVFISAEAIQDGKIDFARRRGFISKADNRRYSRKYSPETGDIYVVKSGATTGKSAMVGEDTDFNIWSPLAVIRSKSSMDSRFVLHTIRNQIVQDAIAINWSWGTQQNIGMGALGRIQVPVPDLATQRQIADFLDRETARIDLLIEKKQRLVALLGEREAALRDRLLQISTDDAVEDLERPWLSGYCGDWNVQRLSYYLRSSPCYGVLKPDNYEGADAVPIIRIKDISDGELQLDDIVTISPQQSQEYSRTILQTGDVVLSVVGTIGKILTVDEIAAGMNLTRALARVQLSEGSSADFLTLVVGSRWFTEYVTVTTQGSAQKVLNMDDLRAWRFPVPPKAEQTRVCEMYREQSASLVATRQKTNTSIDRLKEYRSALITAAVTGQIDVSTYPKSGTPDRRLDAIQEEMGA